MTPVFAVVSAVAKATDADRFELPPLHEAIDPEALNTLFRADSCAPETQVDFRYTGYRVVVRGTGAVHVRAVHQE
ncbi:HalOD1 output domain-containing protein [Natronorubrum tibetense]|uniref:Halobacterial output domain-containing protein n=1 Tax=Natronorubrum tibetense GA33 TaxID=1114856 RepID=L9VLD8_9EURY|nr:HalOD1 output domain-containing protein [Natronorubrum tibetense]ELY37787.1 hypothetical protein C496_19815 [Natronorubrum tibetense GA33]